MDRMHYELRILPLFEEQLSETVFYISERLKNPIAADNFIDAVEAAIYERLQAPEAFQPYPSKRDREHTYYMIPSSRSPIACPPSGTRTDSGH